MLSTPSPKVYAKVTVSQQMYDGTTSTCILRMRFVWQWFRAAIVSQGLPVETGAHDLTVF